MSTSRFKRFDAINITPLTDIFLVLLIIMMVVAPLLDYKGLKLELPTASSQATPQGDPPLTLTLQADGSLQRSDGERISLNQLPVELKTAHATEPSHAGVLLLVPPSIPYAHFAAAVDALQANRISKLSIQRGK